MKKMLKMLIVFTITSFQLVYATPDEAHKFVDQIAGKVIAIVENTNLNDEDKTTQLTTIFKDVVDIKWISLFVLGKHAKAIEPAILSEYEKYYTAFLIKSYIPSFKKYTGQKLKVLKVSESGTDKYRVDTEIISNRNVPLDIDYIIRKNSKGNYKIIDIIAENISLIATQRSEFGSILDNNNIAYLIEKLKERQ